MNLRRYLDPRTTWRDTTDVDKVRLYTRQSFVSIIVLLGVVALAESVTERLWVSGVALAVTAGATVITVHRMPIIGGMRTGEIRWPLAVTAVAAVVAGIAGTATFKMWALLIVAIPVTALIPLRWSAAIGVVAGVATGVSPYGPLAGVIAFVVVVGMAATVKLSMWLLAVVTELDASREAAALLSVAEERLRFSRDLHDVVGRALSAIAVKSELAATLSRRGDERAAEQMEEVRDLAQHSMTEARQLVRGYRSIDLAAELNGACSLLRAAGIETTVTGSPDDVSPHFSEAAAWIVREGATNILRHSDATHSSFDVTENSVRITNNVPHRQRTTDGTGLAGLRERLAAVGGTVDTTLTEDDFTLTATFASTSASASASTSTSTPAHPTPAHPGHSAGSTPKVGS
ncbi:MAG: histidine kinase [Rhodococcus fascians]